MAALMLQVIPSLYAKFSKNSHTISANTYEKKIVIKNHCIAHHDAHICLLPKCRYHISLLGNVEVLVQELDVLCFTYQHVDCLNTLLKHRFGGNIVVGSSKMFDNVQRAVAFSHRNRGVDRKPSIAKNRLLMEKHRKHRLSSFQKTKSTQTSRSVLEKRYEQFKNTN